MLFWCFLLLGLAYLLYPLGRVILYAGNLSLDLAARGRDPDAVQQAFEEVAERRGSTTVAVAVGKWVLWPVYLQGVLDRIDEDMATVEEKTRPFRLHLPPKRED